jgi:hypothetical protein
MREPGTMISAENHQLYYSPLLTIQQASATFEASILRFGSIIITNPEALGELSITGFGATFTRMNADTLRLAIGEDAEQITVIPGLL